MPYPISNSTTLKPIKSGRTELLILHTHLPPNSVPFPDSSLTSSSSYSIRYFCLPNFLCTWLAFPSPPPTTTSLNLQKLLGKKFLHRGKEPVTIARFMNQNLTARNWGKNYGKRDIILEVEEYSSVLRFLCIWGPNFSFSFMSYFAVFFLFLVTIPYLKKGSNCFVICVTVIRSEVGKYELLYIQLIWLEYLKWILKYQLYHPDSRIQSYAVYLIYIHVCNLRIDLFFLNPL